MNEKTLDRMRDDVEDIHSSLHRMAYDLGYIAGRQATIPVITWALLAGFLIDFLVQIFFRG